MVLRYVIRMIRRPDQRWDGGAIPIVSRRGRRILAGLRPLPCLGGFRRSPARVNLTRHS
jgi:hypothetical protein